MKIFLFFNLLLCVAATLFAAAPEEITVGKHTLFISWTSVLETARADNCNFYGSVPTGRTGNYSKGGKNASC